MLLANCKTSIAIVLFGIKDQKGIYRFPVDAPETPGLMFAPKPLQPINEQILDEDKNPILQKLTKLFADKELVITTSALSKAKNLIENYGSASENKILKDFILKLTVIDDQPSDRIENLSRKQWSRLNKNVFGTADKLSIPVVTGNVNAINSLINDYEFDIEYIAHRSRCFVGKKYI